MHVQQVLPHPQAPIQLHAPGIVSTSRTEKNWAPLADVWNVATLQWDHLFARFVDPHQVLQCNRAGHCIQAASTNNTAFFSAFKTKHGLFALHLGTNAVLVSPQRYGWGVREMWTFRVMWLQALFFTD